MAGPAPGQRVGSRRGAKVAGGSIAARAPRANSYRLNRGRVVYYSVSAEFLADSLPHQPRRHPIDRDGPHSNFKSQKRIEAHIYTLELATGKLTRLTTQDYNEHAQYSPDGRTIAWMSTNGIRGRGTDYWLMDADGSNKRRLTYFNKWNHPEYTGESTVVADLSWRPDGTAFAGYTNKVGAFASKTRPTKIILIELSR
jgi:hypothetical protein